MSGSRYPSFQEYAFLMGEQDKRGHLDWWLFRCKCIGPKRTKTWQLQCSCSRQLYMSVLVVQKDKREVHMKRMVQQWKEDGLNIMKYPRRKEFWWMLECITAATPPPSSWNAETASPSSWPPDPELTQRHFGYYHGIPEDWALYERYISVLLQNGHRGYCHDHVYNMLQKWIEDGEFFYRY